MIIYIICKIKEDILGHTCSMHGVVQKCIGLENLIRKYEGIYYRRLEDNITNKGTMRDVWLTVRRSSMWINRPTRCHF